MDPREAPNPAALWQAWPLAGPWRLTRLAEGANNHVYRADTRWSGSYVLRLYRDGVDLARVRHEIALITALRACDLPFAVPRPVPTCSGDGIHHLAVPDAGKPAFAVLWEWIAGVHPDPGDARSAFAAGAALATVDRALAQLAPDTLPTGATPPMGDLRRRIPAVPDPAAALDCLPVDASSRSRLLDLLAEVDGPMPVLYAALPQQVIHGDFDASNMLVDAGRVTGVLDFEFSGHDLRVADLATLLMVWPFQVFGTGAEWPLLDAIGRGYVAQLPLLPAELDAFPALFRLRMIGGLLAHVARYQRGLVSREQLAERAALTLAHDDWLRQHGQRLVDRMQGWLKPPAVD